MRPSHLDTHKHTHVVPSVLSAVMRVAEEFEIRFIRLPFDSGWALVQPLSALVPATNWHSENSVQQTTFWDIG